MPEKDPPLDPPWQERERELRFSESALSVATSADRLCTVMDALRRELATTPAERFTRAHPRQVAAAFLVLVALSSLVGACVGLAFGGAS